MAKWKGTLIGGGIGWVLGGPIGGIIGAVIGNMMNSEENVHQRSGQNYTNRNTHYQQNRSTPGDFAVSMLVLFAYVTKADKKILSSEIQYVKKYLIQKFGATNAQQMMHIYKTVLDKNYNLQQVCQQINTHMDYYSKLEMLHILFGVANADKHINEQELQAISQIANYLGISASEYNSIKAIFVKNENQFYKILNVQTNATNDEIKKAYREMAVKYHPDKVANLGEELQKVAEEKFKAVNNAYQAIRQERGF